MNAIEPLPAVGDARSVTGTLVAPIEAQGLSAVPENAEDAAQFMVNDPASAAWVVRKIVEARAHAERVRGWAAAELRRAEQDERWFLQRFGGQLEGWLRAELTRIGGRRRCVALPAGAVGLRQQPARLEIVDEATVATWCRQHLPEALRIAVEADGADAADLVAWCAAREDRIRQRQQVLREPLNRHLAGTGELPEGVEIRPAQDLFYVK